MEGSLHYLLAAESATQFLIAAIEYYGLAALSFGVFLLGEAVIIIALLLTQQGVLSVEGVLIAATIGTLLADVFWFTIGRYYPAKAVPPVLRQKLVQPTDALFEKLIHGRLFLSLLLLRFFIGTRLMIILHVSRGRISWLRFLLYDFLGTVIYILVLAIIGIHLGRTIHNALPAFQMLTSVLSGLLIIIIISAVARQVLLRTNQTKQVE